MPVSVDLVTYCTTRLLIKTNLMYMACTVFGPLGGFNIKTDFLSPDIIASVMYMFH